MLDDDGAEPPAPPTSPQRSSLSTANAAQMLSEYATAPAAAASWDSFVAFNWLPLLSLALGPEWRTKYDGEVAAMIALQLSLQLPTADAAGAGADASAPSAAPQHAEPAVALAAPASVPAPTGGAQPAARAFTVEAVDVDGKRRRLRRKRAASPDSPDGAASTAAAFDAPYSAPAASTPQPQPQRAQARPSDECGGSGIAAPASGEAAPPAAGAARPSLMQRVIRQVSKLNINAPPAASQEAAAPPPAAVPCGPGAAARGPAAARDGAAATAARPELHRGMLDSLSLVHDLSQRVGASVSEDVAAQGLPPQKQQPAPGGAGNLPLGMLLGGSLVDRMDLLGRTALHVAAATGRADVVRQLVAAGASPCKALPMDYRTLLRQHTGAEEEEEDEEEESDSEECTDSCRADGRCRPCAALSSRRPGPRVPPPKRGRYVTAGPPQPGPPSLQYCTPLHLAALFGQVDVVAALLATGQCDVNAKSADGATALHLAAYSGHEAVVAALCRARGTQLDALDLQGRAPLHAAAARGHEGTVAELWARGAGIDPCDLHGWTALHYAARAGHTEVAAKLVIAGAAVGAADPHGVTPAHLAAERGFSDIIDKLLLAGYVPDSVAGPLADGTEGGTALHLAAAQGCCDAARALLAAGADPRRLDFSARNALDLAVLHGHTRLVAPLLDAGCWFTNGSDYDDCPPQPAPGDPAARQLQLLRCLAAEPPTAHAAWAGLGAGDELVAESFRLSFAECAARAGQLEVLQALHRRGLDLRGRAGGAVLAAAVHAGAPDLVGWLLEDGRCDVAAALAQEDLLHEAASRGDAGVLRALLAADGGAGLGRADGRGLGRTPLHSAVIHGQPAAAELLIAEHVRRGGPQAGQGQLGDASAPTRAAEDGATEPPGTQAAAAAGLDAVDSEGLTALHWAAMKGSTGTLRSLLAAGASAAVASREGQTPLHLAAKAGAAGAAHALLDAGAAPAAADAHGCLPLHYCALRGDLALFVQLFSPSAPALAASPAAGAALLTAAIRGGSSEMVGIVLATGAATPAACAAAGQTPAHAAASQGCLHTLQYLRGAGFDLAELDSEQKSPLHHAPIGYGQAALVARRGADHSRVADALLAAGCAVDARDAHGCTPLHFAAGAGALGMLCRFVKLGPGGAAGVDAPDSVGWTPLFWACNNGHAAAAERLLAEGASPWSKDCNQRLPLHFASEAGHVACVRLLAAAMRRTRDPAAGAPPAAGATLFELKDQNGQTPVQLAAEHGHPDCAALLLDADGTAEAKRRTALHLAAQQGQLAIAGQVLAVRRAAVAAKDADGWLPIHYAAAGGHTDIVAALLAAGSDAEEPAADGDAPLHKAAIGGHVGAVRALRARAQLDQRNASGSTPLYNAASQGHVGVMRELAEGGAAVDAATTNGCSPLYIAANNGFAKAAALLLELGADPDAETSSGCTPLHAAALNGHAAVVAHLVAAGCDVDVQSQNGSSALHNAASAGHAAVVEALLAARADCDVQNGNGNTPLHLAAGKGWAEVAERLAAAGADPCIRNSKGWLAIQSASNSGCFDIVLKLAQHGSPWRLKGDADVVKLLARKSSYKPSYVEGRLRLAEKERQRRLAKQAAEAESAPGGGQPDLGRAAAAADAAMAELLQEEAADQERAERQKAKRAARKQKAAAKRQAAEDEERRRREAEQAEAAAAGSAAASEAAAEEAASAERAASAPAASLAEQLEAADLRPADSGAVSEVQPRQRQQQGGKQTATAPAAAPKALSAANSTPQAAASPLRSVAAAGSKTPLPATTKQGRASDGAPGSPAPRAAPHVVAAPRHPAVAKPARSSTAAGPYAAAVSGQPHPRHPAPPAPAPAPAPAPVTRPAPWAGVAAARAHALQQQPQPQPATPPSHAPGITRPAHITSTLAPSPAARLDPPTAHAWPAGAPTLPPAHPHGSSLLRSPVGQPPQYDGTPVQAALSLLHGPNVPVVAGGSVLPPQPAPLLPPRLPLSPALGIVDALAQQQQQPQQQPQQGNAAAASFVPLFGLHLPTFQGLGVDWSMQGGAAATAFGSPARQAVSAFPAPPAASPAATPPSAPPAATPPPAFQGGSFSPSDASSVESTEADEQLAAGPHPHFGRSLAPDADATLMLRGAPPGAAAGAQPGVLLAPADADGIDDVLRLQPWLE